MTLAHGSFETLREHRSVTLLQKAPVRNSHIPRHNFNLTTGAAFGAAGQRCMALSTVVWVGEAREWIHEVVEKAKQLKVSAGW